MGVATPRLKRLPAGWSDPVGSSSFSPGVFLKGTDWEGGETDSCGKDRACLLQDLPVWQERNRLGPSTTPPILKRLEGL